jgi:hypothetical protein
MWIVDSRLDFAISRTQNTLTFGAIMCDIILR